MDFPDITFKLDFHGRAILGSQTGSILYHAENGNITVQRARCIEHIPVSFTCPLRALQDANEPKPDFLRISLFLNLVLQMYSQGMNLLMVAEAVLDALAQPDKSRR